VRRPLKENENRMLSVAEIMRALGRYRFELRGEYRVPLAVLASIVGISRPSLYRAAWGYMSTVTRAKLSYFIDLIESGRLRFPRLGREWQVDYRTPPNPLPLPQDRLVRVVDWNEWAPCRCGGRRFMPLIIGGRLYRACDQCMPEDQWPAIGGRPTDTRRPRRIR
jgi:hypothetical protein